jgi:septal ring factor EnvC (AmiA/AmiB activator)
MNTTTIITNIQPDGSYDEVTTTTVHKSIEALQKRKTDNAEAQKAALATIDALIADQQIHLKQLQAEEVSIDDHISQVTAAIAPAVDFSPAPEPSVTVEQAPVEEATSTPAIQ